MSPSRRLAEIEGQQTHGESIFPYVFASDTSSIDDHLDWVSDSREQLLESATKNGAVAFRGFASADVMEFDRFIQRLSLANFPYKKSLSNAVRVNRTERVFSANEAPSGGEDLLPP